MCALICGPLDAIEQESAPLPSISARISRTDGPTHVVYGFFHPDTGERVARLQIGKITREFGKQGVFRVAWKARPVLNDFQLTVSDATAWPAVAGQLADLLTELSSPAGIAIHRVTLELAPGQAPITAPAAEWTDAGAILLPHALRGTEKTDRVVLPLRGASAGWPAIFQTKLAHTLAPP